MNAGWVVVEGCGRAMIDGMSNIDDPDDLDALDEIDETAELDELDETEGLTRFDRSRADYTGVNLSDEFQPVDEIELSEEGMLLDDPERLAVLADGSDDPDGTDAAPRATLDPDEVGWDSDLDE